jgi:hypothetical protein
MKVSNTGGTDGTPHISFLFVANLNVDGGKLKANVNRFSNDNVWNADNRNRVVVSQHTNFSSSLRGGVFVQPLPPATQHPTDFL